MTVKTTANWLVELNTTCPHCKKYVDLLEYPDFWDGRRFVPCENRTDSSRDVDVVCPECHEEFTVDLEF